MVPKNIQYTIKEISGLEKYGVSTTASSTYGAGESIKNTAQSKIDSNLKSGKPVIILVRGNYNNKYTSVSNSRLFALVAEGQELENLKEKVYTVIENQVDRVLDYRKDIGSIYEH